MTETPSASPYTLRDLEQMLGERRAVIAGLVGAGHVAPARGTRNEYRFSFQDVVLLRTALHLRRAGIPARQLTQSLKQLREQLPSEVPLSGLRITVVGSEVAVREGDAQWAARSGQLLMDFDVAASKGSVSFLTRSDDGPARDGAHTHKPRSADGWFAEGIALEITAPDEAEAAYRQALALAPDHVDAVVNLGALLCDTGRCADAVTLYEQAVQVLPHTAHVHFNGAIALEDQGRDADALDSYARCLDADPELADAHYNAARLCEKLGDHQRALRHYSAYRRLMSDAMANTCPNP